MIPRRSVIFLTASVFTLFILLRREWIPRPGISFEQPESRHHAPQDVVDVSFNWASMRQQYPVSSYASLPSADAGYLPRVQYDFRRETQEAAETRSRRREEVKRSLTRCWQSYRERAWLADELTPISGTSRTSFGGWAATLVDTLDTLWIMDMKDEFAEAVNATLRIDFSTSPMRLINIFETTIRYLGGFLAAYDLSGDIRLLNKSLELAEMIYHAFDTPNRMPVTRWHLHEAARGVKQTAEESVLSAEIGSLELELTRLSQITQDPRWHDAGQRVMSVFEQQQNKSSVPGMWPVAVNARTQDFSTGSMFSLGAMSDSLYEYLPKMFAMLGGSKRYARLYNESMNAVIKHSLFRPLLPDNADVLITGPLVAENPGEIERKPEGQHLACFAGGMLALGGRLIDEQRHVDIGRKLTDGCIWAYDNCPLGIMPETFSMFACTDPESCSWDEGTWKADILQRASTGLSIEGPDTVIDSQRLPKAFTSMPDRRYILRPEAIESVFYMYRITGEQKYQEAAWRMFRNIGRHTETGIANAALRDMSDPSAPKSDSMESFWTAETLKYFYLIFSEPGLINLDEWVLNTKAHPFRRPMAKDMW